MATKIFHHHWIWTNSLGPTLKLGLWWQSKVTKFGLSPIMGLWAFVGSLWDPHFVHSMYFFCDVWGLYLFYAISPINLKESRSLTYPQLLNGFNCESKGENNGRRRSWGMLLSSQHFGGKGACWSSEMGTRKSHKLINYSHGPTQTKQQIDYCIVGALLVHGRATGKLRLIRLTTAQTWGKALPSPL
jgi:hypothetical protein